ncbi:MAG: hypothetical protein ABEJ95_04545 [Candidatus Nanohalobium sp.]
METDCFASELGDVAVTRESIERQRSNSKDWERIREKFSEQKLVEKARFEDIEDIELEKNSIYPCIELRIDGEWRKLFFRVGDRYEECFRRLRYRWQAYRQNH